MKFGEHCSHLPLPKSAYAEKNKANDNDWLCIIITYTVMIYRLILVLNNSDKILLAD